MIRRHTIGLVAVAGSLLASTFATTPTLASPSPIRVPHSWTHHKDMDGDGVRDTVKAVAGKDLEVDHGVGNGHFRVHVDLSGGGHDSVRLETQFWYGNDDGKWTPWYGATQFDQHPGREVFFGAGTGAYTVWLHGLYVRNGELHRFSAPGYGKAFIAGGSYGTGNYGWKCTDTGIQHRIATPNRRHTKYDLKYISFVFRQGDWERTGVRRDTMYADSNGDFEPFPPGFGSFACKGLR